MDNQILVTIDFDGCVSPIDRSKDFAHEEGFSVMKLAGFPCAVRDEVINFLNTLSTMDKAQPLWASSWEENLSVIHKDSNGRIPDLPWLEVGSSKKESVFHQTVNEGYRKVVIIEDSSQVNRKLRKLFKEWNANNPPIDYLILQPKLEEGLTNTHIKKILKFIEN